jgi:hypothetical protein
MKELIEKMEQVDEYFMNKSYLPHYELRLNIRDVIDYIKRNEAQKFIEKINQR